MCPPRSPRQQVTSDVRFTDTRCHLKNPKNDDCNDISFVESISICHAKKVFVGSDNK